MYGKEFRHATIHCYRVNERHFAPEARRDRGARFDAIELFENDFINFNGSARQLRTITGDLGLGIDLPALARLRGRADAQFRRNLDRAERKLDLMQEMGAPLMLVCSTTSPMVLPDELRAVSQTRY